MRTRKFFVPYSLRNRGIRIFLWLGFIDASLIINYHVFKIHRLCYTDKEKWQGLCKADCERVPPEAGENK